MVLNAGQENFLNFIIERTQAGKEEAVKALMMERFGKQADGTFDQKYKSSFISQLLAMVKPENVEDVKNMAISRYIKGEND